jgi:hypothetical protein
MFCAYTSAREPPATCSTLPPSVPDPTGTVIEPEPKTES